MGRTYRVTILGCRVNHAEAREIESVLAARGLVPASHGTAADVEVVHTCSVTGTAAAKSRQAVRRAARRRTDRARPAVFVTGCYAGTDPREARALIGEPHLVLPHAEGRGARTPGGPPPSMLERFAERLDHWLTDQGRGASADRAAEQNRRASIRGADRCSCVDLDPSGPAPVVPLPVVAPPAAPGRHVRAELKIQDGCDAHCTFCIIPSVRPLPRSKRIADAVLEARRLVDLGHPEIVLSGVFLGAYGHATALRRRQAPTESEPLADLLDAVARVPGLRRLRLSSLEPGDVTPALLDAMISNAPVVTPHLHLPLQSGSDDVLRRMNRQYRTGEYLEMIDQVHEVLTDAHGLPPALTTDVICGFPGETEADFQRTVAVARRVGFLHMHVFPYSPRPGTAAARWVGSFVPPETVRRRVRRLIELEEDPADGLSIAFRRRLLGRTVRVILEQPRRGRPGVMTGRCDHYALVTARIDRPRGTLVDLQITEVAPTRTVGTPVPAALPLPVLRR